MGGTSIEWESGDLGSCLFLANLGLSLSEFNPSFVKKRVRLYALQTLPTLKA